MKIGICARTWAEKGGIGVYTRKMIPNLLRIDNENEYTLFVENDEVRDELSAYSNATVVTVPLKSNIFGSAIATLMWDQVTTPRMASERNIDVLLHTKMAVPLFAKMKTAMVLHGTERYFYPEFQNFYNELYLKTIYQQYLNKADLIIADAENARKDMVEQAGVDASKVKVAHLAGDEEFHVIEDAEKLEHVKSKYNLPDRFLIFVGHIYPGKNIGRLLGAFAKVRKDEDIALVLVGGMRRKFQDDLSRIEELGLEDCVQLTGYVPLDDLVALYNLAEATVFPSIYECFPAPPLDAGSCGCPVITSNTGGTPESAGDAAEYVDPFDEDDIARGIVKVMTDTAWREELIRRGFENNKRFSWEKTAQNTLDALTALHHA